MLCACCITFPDKICFVVCVSYILSVLHRQGTWYFDELCLFGARIECVSGSVKIRMAHVDKNSSIAFMCVCIYRYAFFCNAGLH